MLLRIFKFTILILSILILSACSQQQESDDFLLFDEELNDLSTQVFSNSSEQLGEAFGIQAGTVYSTPRDIAFDANNTPYVLWESKNNATTTKPVNIYVSQWDGTNWVRLGSHIDNRRDVNALGMFIDANGFPVVLWKQYEDRVNKTNLYVSQWNGSEWLRLGQALDFQENASISSAYISEDKQNRIVVAWNESTYNAPLFNSSYGSYVKQWNGSSWELLGDAGIGGSNEAIVGFDVATNRQGYEIMFLAYLKEDAQGNDNIGIKRWTGTRWNSNYKTIVPFNPDGRIWEVKMQSHFNGNPVIAWREFTPEDDGAAYSDIYAGIYSFNDKDWRMFDVKVNDTAAYIGKFDLTMVRSRPIITYSLPWDGESNKIASRQFNFGTSEWMELDVQHFEGVTSQLTSNSQNAFIVHTNSYSGGKRIIVRKW